MLISIPNIFSAGAVIVASQHNSNFSTIVNCINGGLDNTNLTGTAGITYANLTLTGQIVNADIASGAAISGSKLNLVSPGAIGSTTPSTGAFTTLKVGTTNQGDILYDNGTSLIRLTPGTSGQFLKTQGASANPTWATVASLSNVIFSFASSCENTGFISGPSLTAAVSGNYTYWTSDANGNTQTIITSKWVKISGVSTVTIWCKIWQKTTSTAKCIVSIGSATGNVAGTGSQTTPEWNSFIIDVSGLTNGTTYDVTIQMSTVTPAGSVPSYLGSIIGIGS